MPRRTRPAAGSILVVDDEVDIRQGMADLLEEEGYVVHRAQHGAEALALLDAGLRPGLVVLDLMMPVMDGWHFLEQVRARPLLARALRVVVCSAAPAQPFGSPVCAVLPKPFELEALLSRVREHCS